MSNIISQNATARYFGQMATMFTKGL